MKKKLTLLTLLYFFNISLFADGALIIGHENNFNGFILKDLTIINGDKGHKNLVLKNNEYEQTPNTDFLAHFNNLNFKDTSENYQIESHYNNISSVEKRLGNSSAFFLKNKGLVYTSNGESIFSPGRLLGDFTIEFWVLPTIISEDTTVFSWKGVNKVDSKFIPQKIKCYFEERKTVWEFENLFIPVDFANYSIKLKGKTKLIPNQWNHHLIRYNSGTGMLEYLMNGIPEDVKFTTKSQKEGIEIYPPYIGNFSKKEIFIGERLRGFIDEFRISESFIEKPILSIFKTNGSFTSPVYDLFQENVMLESITVTDKIPSETLINYEYRFSENPFLINNNNIPWLPINNNSILKGRYIQIRAYFYSNGSETKSPLLESIKIKWNTIPKPPKPIAITSIPDKNSIIVKWNPIKHYKIDGYYLYIGSESNNYVEMIDVGNNTSYNVENLTSKNIYYFSVRSYYDNKVSDYSLETFNRPE